MPEAEAIPNTPATAATSYELAAVYTSYTPEAETPQLCYHFAYYKQSLMADKIFWHHHENIPPNVIGMFENNIMYGNVVSVTRSSAKAFDYTLEWDMLRLSDEFTIY